MEKRKGAHPAIAIFIFWRRMRNDVWGSFGAGRNVHDSAVPTARQHARF
jgi:hypothetical protein